MNPGPRDPPPTPALLAALSVRYGSAADDSSKVIETHLAFLALLSRGRAISASASPQPMHARPEAEACDTEGLALEYVSIEVERGERCPLLLCRATGGEGAATVPLRPVFVLHGPGKSLADLVFAHGWADEQVMAHLNRVADAISATDTDEDAVGALNLHLNGRRTSSRR